MSLATDISRLELSWSDRDGQLRDSCIDRARELEAEVERLRAAVAAVRAECESYPEPNHGDWQHITEEVCAEHEQYFVAQDILTALATLDCEGSRKVDGEDPPAASGLPPCNVPKP